MDAGPQPYRGPAVNGRGFAAGVGPVHITLIGFVVLAAVGLVLMRKVGFRFSVVASAGGR